METPKTGEFAHIGKSVVIKGELSGSEDLYVDGQVSGTIELRSNSLTIGPNGQVKANVSAKVVIVLGKVEGNLQAADRVELRKSAVMVGDITTRRISIEDGAYLNGKVDIQKESATPAKSEPKASAAGSAGASTLAGAAASASASSPPQSLPFEKK